MQRGIVNHAEELRQHLLIDLLGEGLPFLLATLAVTFQAVAEHFVKEHCGCSARKQCRTVEGFGQWGCPQSFQVRRHFFNLGGNLCFAGEAIGRSSLERFHPKQFHAVVRASFRLNHQSDNGSRVGELTAVA